VADHDGHDPQADLVEEARAHQRGVDLVGAVLDEVGDAAHDARVVVDQFPHGHAVSLVVEDRPAFW